MVHPGSALTVRRRISAVLPTVPLKPARMFMGFPASALTSGSNTKDPERSARQSHRGPLLRLPRGESRQKASEVLNCEQQCERPRTDAECPEYRHHKWHEGTGEPHS